MTGHIFWGRVKTLDRWWSIVTECYRLSTKNYKLSRTVALSDGRWQVVRDLEKSCHSSWGRVKRLDRLWPIVTEFYQKPTSCHKLLGQGRSVTGHEILRKKILPHFDYHWSRLFNLHQEYEKFFYVCHGQSPAVLDCNSLWQSHHRSLSVKTLHTSPRIWKVFLSFSRPITGVIERNSLWQFLVFRWQSVLVRHSQ